MSHKFKAFLDGRTFGDSLDKPYVYDMQRDKNLPDPENEAELIDYIESVAPDSNRDGAVSAAGSLWQLYEQHKDFAS